MVHELHGEWHLYIIRPIDDQGHLESGPDGTVHLQMTNAQTGVIESQSTHGPSDLTGKATRTDDGGYSIEITEKLAGTEIHSYNGFLIDRVDVPGGRVLVMSGVRTTPVGARKQGKKAKTTDKDNATALDDGQNDGTWVMTKP
jgi:hypothetical protein